MKKMDIDILYKKPYFFWYDIREVVRTYIDFAAFNLWILPLQVISIKNQKISLLCPNDFNKINVEERFLHIIKYAAKKLTDTEFNIELAVYRKENEFKIDEIPIEKKSFAFKPVPNVFLIYGKPDYVFAKKMESDLTMNDVCVWFFPNDAEIGQKIHQTIRNNINKYERVLLLCSKNSIIRNGVLYEIEMTLSREAREGGNNIIIPLAIDKFIFSNEFKRTKIGREIHDRIIVDFSNPQNYKRTLQKLIFFL